jgi:hypothetical protein
MKKQIFYYCTLFFLINFHFANGQNTKKLDKSKTVTKLFANQNMLPIKLSFSNKEVKNKTNDSTYIKTNLSYLEEDKTWRSMNVKIRARGNFRRKNCYFPPVKIKIDKSESKSTLFKGNKKLKLVLPCSTQQSSNDNIIEEYLAYKLYEIVTPYHFKTRLVNVELTEQKRSKTKIHHLKGILQEDYKLVAKRFNGKVYKRFIHPMEQDPLTCVQNAFFQCMIANTDFSIAYQHNGKLLYIDKKIIPVPFDFDMSGLVNANYAVVSQVQNKPLDITRVTQRKYRGFKRDKKIILQVRQEYIDNKQKLFEIIDRTQEYFNDPKQFKVAKDFINGFYKILEDDKKFNRMILSQLRTK